MTGKKNQISSPVGSPSSGNISDSFSKDQDRFLPIANVSRIMKKSLPANAKISKEAKETVQECVSEFISFITGEASDKCQREKRKTINGDDLLWAMTTLGFENYVGPLKVYLNKYRETEGEKNTMARQEDQYYQHYSPTNTNNNNLIGLNGSSLSTDHQPPPVDLQGFGNGFYSLGAQVTAAKSSGENSVAAFGINAMRENGGGNGNGNRAMATALHHGIGW